MPIYEWKEGAQDFKLKQAYEYHVYLSHESENQWCQIFQVEDLEHKYLITSAESYILYVLILIR